MRRKLISLIISFFIVISFSSELFSQEKKKPIIVDGDKVEFFAEDKQITAEGSVIITYQDTTLTCEKIKVNTQTKDAFAEGDVHLVTLDGEIRGEAIEYNFDKMVGKIVKGRMKAKPFFGEGEFIERINEKEFQIKRGFFTTCDLDKPHYRLQSKKIDMFPGDKVVARDIVVKLGQIPLFYLPKFIQRLDEKRPRVRVIPGKDKEWGYFVLQAWRYDFNDIVQGRLHLDYREKRDFAWGWDNYFNTSLLGKGVFRTYYTHERKIKADHIYSDPRDTEERERYRIQLLQNKKIDNETNMVFQFNRMSDDEFVKDYFFREYEKEYRPDSYLLLTQAKPYHSLSLLLRKRFNRYFAETEKLPEVKLDIPSYKIGNSTFYYSNESGTGILENKGAAPSDLKQKIFRFDTFNKLSYQKKVAFIETNPYIAIRETYFSKDINRKDDIWRNVLYSGIDLSTKFYRIFDVNQESLFLKFDRLRHIITPTISYQYIRKPSVDSSDLIQYDDVDSISKGSSMSFSLENKLQTKRKKKTIDFLRFIASIPYTFKHQQQAGGNFGNVNCDLELIPTDWIRIYADSVYDRGIDKFSTINLDFNFRDTSKPHKWELGIGKRYSRNDSNQITMDLYYRPNNKWKFKVYQRLYPHSDSLIEQGYTVARDLHCWEVEMNYNVRRGWGETLWFIFRIKAFPEMEFDWNKEYNRPKPGSQSQ